MQGQSSPFGRPATSLELRYTGKPVSGWGGLVAVMRYLERRGVRRVLASALPDGRTSPNQIPVVDMVLAFFAGVLTGSRRFAHVERLRSDEVVRTILGLTRMPSAMTLTRYFGGLVRSHVEHLSAVLGSSLLASSGGRHSAPRWIWIRPCSSAMAAKRAVSRAIIHASMAVLHITRCWRFWPRLSWCCTPGYAAAIRPARAASRRFWRRRWRGCRRIFVSMRCAPIQAFS